MNGKKDYARRTIKVSSSVVDMVKQLEQSMLQNKIFYKKKEFHKTTEYLFTSNFTVEMKKPNYYLNIYRKELKKRNINVNKYNLYKFRHTYCTNLFKNHKLDPKTVQLMMGDNSLDMVLKVYHSVNKNDMIVASGAYSDAMDKILGIPI